MTTVAFPGLGIERFTLNPTAFTIPLFGGIEVKWYGIIITFGIVLAFLYCAYRAKQQGIVFDDLIDVAIFTIIFAIVGARVGYVLFSLDQYDSFLEMINIRNGGLQIYGGIIAGFITVLIVCKVKKLNTLKIFDSIAPALLIGQIIGRWGNFMNGEAHGGIGSEKSPLYFIRMELSPYYMNGEYHIGPEAVHPTFLYESLWNLIGFMIIHFTYKKKKFDGQFMFTYFAWYGFGRMFIEMLRTDSLTVKDIRVSVVIGAVTFVVGTAGLIYGLIKAKKNPTASNVFKPIFKNAEPVVEAAQDDSDETVTEEVTETKEDIEQKFNELVNDNKNDEGEQNGKNN